MLTVCNNGAETKNDQTSSHFTYGEVSGNMTKPFGPGDKWKKKTTDDNFSTLVQKNVRNKEMYTYGGVFFTLPPVEIGLFIIL
jgi:hypothetical protein